MIRKRPGKTSRTGCGLVLVTCAVTCLLLVLNRVLVTSLYAALVPPTLNLPRFRVIVQFLAMIAFLLPEWWLLDRLLHPLRSLSKVADAFRARR